MVLPVDPAATPTSAADASLGGLGPDAFLKLLVAQMRYQNPMEPNDGSAMLQQTAQFTTVETLKEIAESQQRLMGLQQVTLALDLVGQHVDAVDVYGTPVSGVVDQIRFTVDGPMLEIDGIEIPLDNVLSIAGPAAPDSPAGS